MARKKDDGESAPDFAERVLDGLARAQAGEPSSEPDRDVRRLVIGLACVAEAVKHHSRAAAEHVGSAETGANEALAIVDALTSGRAHPIWKYLEGIRSFKHKPQHAPVNAMDAQRQYVLIGCARAYLTEAKRTHPNFTGAKAVRAITRACSLPDFSFDEQLILKSWIKNYKLDAGAMKCISAWEDWANRIAEGIAPSEPLLERIIEASRRLIWRAWSVPVLQGNQAQT